MRVWPLANGLRIRKTIPKYLLRKINNAIRRDKGIVVGETTEWNDTFGPLPNCGFIRPYETRSVCNRKFVHCRQNKHYYDNRRRGARWNLVVKFFSSARKSFTMDGEGSLSFSWHGRHSSRSHGWILYSFFFFVFASSSIRPVARTQYTYHANVRMLRKIAARVWCFCGPRKFARSGLKNRKTKKKILNALYVRRRAQWTTEEKNDLPTHQLWRAKR